MSALLAPTSPDKPWLKSYPEGVPAAVKVDSYRSLVALLEEAFRKHAQRDAAICMGQRLSFRQVDELSQALGAWLQAKGLERGSRVAIMMPNVLQYMVAIAAILRAGYTVVNVNPLYTARELEHQLKDSGARAIIVLENFAATLEEVIERTEVRHVLLTGLGDLLSWWKGPLVNFAVRHLKKMVPEYRLPLGPGRSVTRFGQALDEGARLHLRPVDLGPEDVAFLQYTGGTTGVSKGATLLHRNVVANILQSEAWFSPMLRQRGDKPMTTVCALPLYHIFALTACYMLGARLGMTNLLIPNPRDIPGFVATLREQRVHMFPAVNTLFNALANDPGFARLDFSELLISNGGGMAVQRPVADQWKAITGCFIAEGYGLSETSPVATANRCDIESFTCTIGLPIPSTEVAILDDDGNHLEIGAVGEIAIRGPQVMAGYWQRPDETSKVMTADGYFRTGDVGVIQPDGQVKIVDRMKDMVLVSGFNVYPNEVEDVLAKHPGVLESAVIGLPDEHSGEAVTAFVVKRDPGVTAEELRAFCKENLTGYKVPKHFVFRETLPKTNVGKVLRRALREEIAAQTA